MAGLSPAAAVQVLDANGGLGSGADHRAKTGREELPGGSLRPQADLRSCIWELLLHAESGHSAK
jgi:hypothetical protein